MLGYSYEQLMLIRLPNMKFFLSALMGISLFSGFASNNPAISEAEPPSTPPPSAPIVGPAYTVSMTAYNAVPAQTDGSPFETASGAYSNPEVVAARSQDLGGELPFGTIIEVTGASSSDACGYSVVKPIIGYRVIADTMNVKFTNRIDILFPTTANYATSDGVQNASWVLGLCHGVSIRVVGHIDLSNPANLPKTQEQLASIVHYGASAPTLAAR